MRIITKSFVRSLRMGFFLLAIPLASQGEELKTTEDLSHFRDAAECSPRGGLPNFFAKCEKGGTVKVAYFGGSITAQAGWRVQSLDLLHNLYSQTKFEEIYAPIGGTGADLGVFRLEHDVIQYKPDIVLVEFATNGGSKNAMEGIVRNIWAALPDCDICFVYTVAGDEAQKLLEEGKFNTNAMTYEKVADHYGVPSIHMGAEAARLAKAGKLEWKGTKAKVEQVAGKELDKVSGIQTNPDGKIPFSPDGVHPYLDTGHNLYTAAIERSLPKIKAASAKLVTHTNLPEPLTADYVKSVTFLDVVSAILNGNWAKIENPGKVLRGEDFDKFVPSVWRGTPGSTLSFKFKGKSLMLYTVSGPGSGFIELTVDGKTSKRNTFDSYSAYWRLNPCFPAKDLDPKVVHTVKIKVLAEVFDKRSIVAKIGREKGYDANPAAFKPTDFVIGGICIEDGTIVGK